MATVMKQVPIDDALATLKEVITRRVGAEVTSTLDDEWWFQFIEFGLDALLYGLAVAEDWQSELTEELEVVGMTPDEATKTFREWLEYNNGYYAQFGLERSKIIRAEKDYSLSLFGLRKPKAGSRLEAWIIINGTSAAVEDACTWGNP